MKCQINHIMIKFNSSGVHLWVVAEGEAAPVVGRGEGAVQLCASGHAREERGGGQEVGGRHEVGFVILCPSTGNLLKC